jgi:hypothetical protein
VVNFEDVGKAYGLHILQGMQDHADNKFHWDGVRLCLQYLLEHNFKVVGVVLQDCVGYDGSDFQTVRSVPQDVRNMCEFVEETPRIYLENFRHASDETTIKLAYRRNCRILDNDDYAGWLSVSGGLRNESIRRWLQHGQEFLHLNYRFSWESECCSFEICGFTRRNMSRLGGLETIPTSEVNHLREGSTPLCTAAKSGDVDLVISMLKRGAHPNIPNDKGMYPIYYAALECKVRMVKALLKYSADLALIPASQYRGLIGNVFWRLGKPHQEKVRRYLLRVLGVDPNAHDPAVAVTKPVQVDTPGGSSQPSRRSVLKGRTRPRPTVPATRTSSEARRTGTRGIAPYKNAGQRDSRSSSQVIRVHDSDYEGPPQSRKPRSRNRERHRQVFRPRLLGLHPAFPYRRILQVHQKRKKKKIAPVVGNIDLEPVDLTTEAEPRPLRRRASKQKTGPSDAVYLKMMRTSGPDATPLIAMVDPYL